MYMYMLSVRRPILSLMINVKQCGGVWRSHCLSITIKWHFRSRIFNAFQKGRGSQEGLGGVGVLARAPLILHHPRPRECACRLRLYRRPCWSRQRGRGRSARASTRRWDSRLVARHPLWRCVHRGAYHPHPPRPKACKPSPQTA